MYSFHTKHNITALCTGLLLWLTAPLTQAGFRFDPQDCITLPAPDTALFQATQRFQDQVGNDFWHAPGRLESLIQQLAALTADGLDPQHYHITDLREVLGFRNTWGSLNDCDAELASFAYLSALADLGYGRPADTEADATWYSPQLGDRRSVDNLLALAGGGSQPVSTTFDQTRPALPRYQNLRQAYQHAREALPARWPTLDPGPTLAPGDRTAEVRLLRQRLQAEGYADLTSTTDPDHFDNALAEAVKAFQRRHYLTADGRVGDNTRAQLNVQPQHRLAQIRANLERMRRLAADLEQTMLLVDIAAARIEYYRQGELAWSGRAQVGQPLRETPRLKSLITHVTVNPSWTIPTTIFVEDKLPLIQQDPGYLEDRNIGVFNYRGDRIDAADVDWNNPRGILLRQAPGPGNALGKVVIRFSNPFAVYLHDTPSSWLFNTNSRFYSSGCVRVEDAMSLAETLIGDAPTRYRKQFEELRASGESHNVHLPRSVPVLLAYWTAEADSDGHLMFRPDAYDIDAPLIADDPLLPPAMVSADHTH
ncbi:L,D-transpeptidase family protein [Marinobacter sp. CA1]|uniref:L,D-transpeptidase family protein n=1 Tax=Marinobacter sp. CA1 TaxID=2817656 RepID=UPI001D07C84A|nr:L,D-transpeptidase family protein [Marinobacter sp. CA1]UDL06430.1 L,D-transpeptidase family protein [Marinobacter sp. CA1]